MPFFNSTFIINLIASFFASIGFAMMFNTNKRHLIHIGIAGFGTYAIYYTFLYFFPSLFWAAFLSTVFTALFSEIIARIRRAPTIIFILTGIVPTVPGGMLYRTMRNLILDEYDLALSTLVQTLEVGLGIAGGIVFVSVAFNVVMDRIKESNKRKKSKNNV